ncbi:OmpA family protein [Dyella humi]|uniref:OmpA family protein n=1 Tax=Dyella humi TaxID=1770547 RepID=A0ABW8IJL4_9GAMM
MKAKHAVFILFSALVCVHVHATTLDFKNVYFKAGQPIAGGNLSDSAVKFNDYAVPALNANASTFLSLKSNAKVKIVGFTDDKECQGDGCNALSLRRAQLVNAWLLSHGFPAERLLAPEGHGSSDPIDTNATADGQQRNRRAEFQIIEPSEQP